MIKCHALKDGDLARRKIFIVTNMAVVDKINTAFTDEAPIPLDGMVNSQNVRRYYSRKTSGG